MIFIKMGNSLSMRLPLFVMEVRVTTFQLSSETGPGKRLGKARVVFPKEAKWMVRKFSE